MSTRRPLAFAALTAMAVMIPLLGSPASASPVTSTVGSSYVSAAGVSALCAPAATSVVGQVTGEVGSALRQAAAPEERLHQDSPVVTDAHVDAIATDRPAAAARQADRVLPDQVVIPVHVTLVRGKHRGDTNRRPKAVRQWINILNDAYAGGQAPGVSAPSRYRFVLKSVRQVRNDAWYHAVGNSRADQQMRRKLHRGSAGALNLYVTKPGRGGDVLGFARFPQQYAATPRLDGVTVNVQAMPGGNIRRYNLGDTLVHEVGHWLGLFHTFEGGCGEDPNTTGDLVADTPAEAEPSYYCDTSRDSCQSPGLDPVQNFMNYSWDWCMNQFTAGQVALMDRSFEQFRYGR